ncbi:hypothetical protein CR513_47729, partial [Mucuna pruriens]
MLNARKPKRDGNIWKNGKASQELPTTELAPDRTQLRRMVKKDIETFKEYAKQWREIVAHVQPPLSEKEMVTMYIDTL